MLIQNVIEQLSIVSMPNKRGIMKIFDIIIWWIIIQTSTQDDMENSDTKSVHNTMVSKGKDIKLCMHDDTNLET